MREQQNHSLILNSQKEGLGNEPLFLLNDSEYCSFLGGGTNGKNRTDDTDSHRFIINNEQ